MASTTIEVSIEWVQVDPDGGECCGCGDACYLWMWMLHIQLGKAEPEPQDDLVLCGSCCEMLDD